MHAVSQGPFTRFFLRFTEPVVFGKRHITLAVLALVTALMALQASRLRPDTGFEKQLPLQHEYMKVFKRYQSQFGGANLVLIAAVQHQGDRASDNDIYNPRFLGTLKQLTDEVFFLPGIDRARVSSLFTPDVRYIEVVEGGFSGGNVIPANYSPTPETLAQIRRTVARANIRGRLVSNDQRGAMVFAELLESDPISGEKLDYADAAHRLENLRGQFGQPWEYVLKLKGAQEPFAAGEVLAREYGADEQAPRAHGVNAIHLDPYGLPTRRHFSAGDIDVEVKKNADYNPDVDLHIIGFAKVVGDVSDAAAEVVGFFGLTLLITLALLWMYCGSLRIALLPLSCALLAVIWELGLLKTFGFGLDPFAILVPFLVLAVGVSHGVQITNFWLYEMTDHGRTSFEASRATFRRLVIPGITALLTNIVGFGTILLIPIGIVQEMAWNACFGCFAIIITKKIVLPILLSYVQVSDLQKFRDHQRRRDALFAAPWRAVARITDRPVAIGVLVAALALYGCSEWLARDLKMGELHAGVPELRPDSRYNLDNAAIGRDFAVGTDIIKVIAQTHAQGCIEYPVMQTIDDFAWRLTNTPGVQQTFSLPQAGRMVDAAFNEASPKWLVLPRNTATMVQSITPFTTSTGLLNEDCSAMPVLIFTEDHKAETISRVVDATKQFEAELPKDSPVHFALASGNVGVMAAANEVIKATERPMLFWVYAAITLCVWLSFRNFTSVICILLPLALVSVLSYAVMVLLGIGLKVATLPIAAFAAGIGVDYGIYIYSVLEEQVAKGLSLRRAYEETLHQTGKAVVFTGLALGASVCTWLLSDLQFQVDMGALLTVMFLANMVGAVVLLPALASFLVKPQAAEPDGEPEVAT
ncbi:MAG TPA: efflux RND transporter permease subunit [Nevskiaceae bacterium]|nr:efflux RND transporter permease subunit [Nevskiaceae bacterium]